MKNAAKDRVKKSRRHILVPLVIIVLGVTGFTIYWLHPGKQVITQPPAVWRKVIPLDETREVALYFGDTASRRLVAEQRRIPLEENPAETARKIIQALLEGPQQEGTRAIPQRTRVKALYITSDDTAVVDFSREIATDHPGGLNAELLTIFSIVKTLTRNVHQIKKVKVLVEGSEIETLAGHIDCLRPFSGSPAWLDGQS